MQCRETSSPERLSNLLSFRGATHRPKWRTRTTRRLQQSRVRSARRGLLVRASRGRTAPPPSEERLQDQRSCHLVDDRLTFGAAHVRGDEALRCLRGSHALVNAVNASDEDARELLDEAIDLLCG